MTRLTRALALLCSLLVLLPPAGCDDDHSPCSPDLRRAALSGRVLTGGDPTICTLEARGVDLPDGVVRLIRTNPDPDGSYLLTVPPGSYTLKMIIPTGVGTYSYNDSGQDLPYSEPDTLDVAERREVAGLDFSLGTLQLQITLPDDGLDGTRAEINLYRQDPEGSGWEGKFFNIPSVEISGRGATLRAEGLPPGDYQVEVLIGLPLRFDGPRDAERFWLPDADGPDQADWYTVTAGSQLDLTFTATGSASHLGGRIGGAWLELGLEGPPELSLVDPDSHLVIDSWPTGKDGSFTLDLYRPRPVRLLITQNGLPQYVGGPDFAPATVFDPQPGETIGGIEVETCAITLDIQALAPSEFPPPVFGIFTSDGSTNLGTVHTNPVSDHIFILPNLWPGGFLVRMTIPSSWRGRSPWVDQWYPGVLEAGMAEPVTLSTPGEIRALSMTPREGGSISGRVLGDPETLTSRIITVTTAEDPDTWGTTYTMYQDLTFTVRGLPDGRYRIGQAAAWQSTQTVWYPSGTDWNSAGVITIEGANSVEGIDIPLE